MFGVSCSTFTVVANEVPANPDAIHGFTSCVATYGVGGIDGGGGAAATSGAGGASRGAGVGAGVTGAGSGCASDRVPPGLATALSSVRLPHTFGTRNV